MSAIVEITCLCAKFQDTVELSSALPISNYTCSCNDCRRTTGVLYLSTLPIAGDQKPSLVDSLIKYQCSSHFNGFSCDTCGSLIIIQETDTQTWRVCTGVVERVSGLHLAKITLENFSWHQFVGDTLDGGLIACLVSGGGDDIPIFMQGPGNGSNLFSFSFASALPSVESFDKINPQEPSLVASPGPKVNASERLHAACHCGGISFFVTRPSEESAECTVPWPDLIVPYHSGKSENPLDVKWWLQAQSSKYLAGTCTCRSCRLATGVSIQTWAFIPRVNLENRDGLPWNLASPTLKQYISSPGCYRGFCGVCSATIFWRSDWRPQLIDVSAGILRAREGARAELWLHWWTNRVSFIEDAVDDALASRLERGLHEIGTNTA
jgi:hypothetical protein